MGAYFTKTFPVTFSGGVMMTGELSVLSMALLGAVAHGGGDFFGGRASLRLTPAGVVVLAQLAALAVAFQAFQWTGRTFGSGPALVPGVLAGVSYAVALIALYRGLALGRAAIVAPVFAITGIALPLLADAVLGRMIGQTQAGGLLLCLVAIVLLSQIPETAPGRDRHLSFRMGLIGGLADGLADVCLGALDPDPAIEGFAIARLTITALALVLFAALVLNRADRRPGPATESPRTLAWAAVLALLAGIGDGLGHLAYVRIATQGSISVASALVGVLSTAVVIALAMMVLRERLTVTQGSGLLAGVVGIVAMTG